MNDRAVLSNLTDPERALVEKCKSEGFCSEAGCNLVDLVRRAGLTLSRQELSAAKEEFLVSRIEALREALDSIVHTTDDIAAERAAEFALKFDETGGS